jgi:predicted small secreted protein
MTLRQVLHVLAALGLLGLAPLLAACNTVAGSGQDLQAAGRAITGSSETTSQGSANPAQTPAPSPPAPAP